MDVKKYFLSLSQELDALKERVRFLIADRHWQTDGEWKESVLRHVLRRHLPIDVVVGRGPSEPLVNLRKFAKSFGTNRYKPSETVSVAEFAAARI